MARNTGTVAPSTRRGLAIVFGLILVVGLAVVFTTFTMFTGPVIRFMTLVGMAIVGFAYPRIVGLVKREASN